MTGTAELFGTLPYGGATDQILAKFGLDPAPEIAAVADVGNDQGRNVRLVWLRSSCDTVGATYQVTSYEVHRRQDADREI